MRKKKESLLGLSLYKLFLLYNCINVSAVNICPFSSNFINIYSVILIV